MTLKPTLEDEMCNMDSPKDSNTPKLPQDEPELREKLQVLDQMNFMLK